jgi:microsomal dipeptidase-like Zn-dependent dipeptidase
MKRKILIALLIVIAVGLAVFFFVVPALVERSLNVTLNPPPYGASERARELHKRLLIADLHSDSLLWDRDLLKRSDRGHLDIPRLAEGNVALQAFTIVTKTPRDQNIESNDDTTDNITLLALAQRWPVASWSSLKERALFQARKLDDFARRSGGKLIVIKTAADLENFVEQRRAGSDAVAGVLGVEGAHALDGDLAGIDELFEAGIRMMAPTHFFDNDLGGSAHGVNKGGLTEKGREMIRRMEEKRMIVDLAHASLQTFNDVLSIATRPVVVSHTGVKGTCDNQRNLTDDQLRAVARTGGVVGIGYWDTATCGADARAIARAIRHAVSVAGLDHVGLGSDYDGGVTVPFDTTGLVGITDALLEEGFTESEIEKVMGGNVLRLLKTNLP